MHKLNQQGSLLAPLVGVVLLLIVSLGFGFWAFAGRQDYKNNVDKKIAEAVVVAEENLSTRKDAEFAEAEKSPYKTYDSPSSFGTLHVVYPKTWSAYVDEKGNSSTPLSGFMHPNYVPVAATETAFAFRFEVLNNSYDKVLQTFEAAQKAGRSKVSAYRLPKVQSALGSRIEGEVSTGGKQGLAIVLPLRDKTIKIWTEGQEFRGDFEAILNEFTFIP